MVRKVCVNLTTTILTRYTAQYRVPTHEKKTIPSLKLPLTLSNVQSI